MVTVEPDVLEALSQPLDPARVKMVEARGGRKQPYLAAFDVKATANRIFGHDGWAPQVVELRCIGEERFQRDGKDGCRVGYVAIVLVQVDGFCDRSDVGYGDATEYGGSMVTCHELAAKEAVSDAMKRAMTSLGDQFGNSLYDKTSTFHAGGGAAQAAKPVDQSPIRAAQERFDLSPLVVQRIERFVMRGDEVTTAVDVDAIVGALEFYAANHVEAEKQIQAWEAEHAESV
jgi:DNA repair and recombination protein RAD52